MTLVRSESNVIADPPLGTTTGSDDPGDDYLIALAAAGNAHLLVSGDAHLLRLADRLPIVSPAEFLQRLEAQR